MRKTYSAKNVATMMQESQMITEAMEESKVPDALDFAWWDDGRLMSYFKNGEWYDLSVEGKSDLYEVLQMRGLL